MEREEIKYYLNHPHILQKEADRICRRHYGDSVFLRGLIEFSNQCDRDCLYCGIRKSNKQIRRYCLTQEEILSAVAQGHKSGLKTFVLQSGEAAAFSSAQLCRLVERIKESIDEEIAITLSCGIKSEAEYRSFKQAGADRYLLRFETADPELHRYLRNGISFQRRIQALSDLFSAGFEVGSGFMTGLPGETEDTLIQNIFLCQKYEFHMVGVGPFIPHPQTPLKDSVSKDLSLSLKATALVRLALPKANIPATTAAGSIEPSGREKMLEWGANVLMPNITPVCVKKDYLLYPGKICLDESGTECISCLKQRVKTAAKQIDFSIGISEAFRIKSL